MWPQYVYFALFLYAIFASAFLHGKKRQGDYSFPTFFIAALIQIIILYYGGFFDPLIQSGFFSR